MQTLRRELRQCFQEIIDRYHIRAAVDIDVAEVFADAALEVRGMAKLATDDAPGEYKTITDAANKKVDAILNFEKQNVGKLNYPGREALPEPIRELIDEFVSVSGIKPIKRELSGWLMIGQEWLDIHAQAKDIRGALNYAKGKYAIMEPASLTKTLRAFKAGALKMDEAPVLTVNSEAIEQTHKLIQEKEIKAVPMPDFVREKLGQLAAKLETK